MKPVIGIVLGLWLLAATGFAVGADAPDYPTPRPPKDRVTHYSLWAMHQVSPAHPPYRYALVNPTQSPLTARACFDALEVAFTAGKRPTEPAHTQIVMLLQWLSVQPDSPPDFAKWIGCWPTGSPYYVAWQMHRSTTGVADEPEAAPFWYRPWQDGWKPMSPEQCLARIRTLTKQRRVALLKWYAVTPDPPPDREKYMGCLPSGFDPEERRPR